MMLRWWELNDAHTRRHTAVTQQPHTATHRDRPRLLQMARGGTPRTAAAAAAAAPAPAPAPAPAAAPAQHSTSAQRTSLARRDTDLALPRSPPALAFSCASPSEHARLVDELHLGQAVPLPAPQRCSPTHSRTIHTPSPTLLHRYPLPRPSVLQAPHPLLNQRGHHCAGLLLCAQLRYHAVAISLLLFPALRVVTASHTRVCS